MHISCHLSGIGQVSFCWPLGKGWGRVPQPAAVGQNYVTYRHIYGTGLVVGWHYLRPTGERLLGRFRLPGNPVFNGLWQCQSWDPGEEELPHRAPFGCLAAVMWRWTTLDMTTGLVLYLWEYRGRFLCREAAFLWVTLTVGVLWIALWEPALTGLLARWLSWYPSWPKPRQHELSENLPWSELLQDGAERAIKPLILLLQLVKYCTEVCPSGVPLPALSPVVSAKGSSTSPLWSLHAPAPGCCSALPLMGAWQWLQCNQTSTQGLPLCSVLLWET